MHQTQHCQHDRYDVGCILEHTQVRRVFQKLPTANCVGRYSEVSEENKQNCLGDEYDSRCYFEFSVGTDSARSDCDVRKTVQQTDYGTRSNGIHRDHSAEQTYRYEVMQVHLPEIVAFGSEEVEANEIVKIISKRHQ